MELQELIDNGTVWRLDELQELIDNGTVWRLEGAAGRAAMAAINGGQAMLGPRPVRDFWGNLVPAWWMVKPGTPGSPEHAGRERPDEPSPDEQRNRCAAVGIEAL